MLPLDKIECSFRVVANHTVTMSNTLISDPILTWFEPKNLALLSQLNKECKSVIKEYQQTKTSYDTRLSFEEFRDVRRALYALYPKVQNLVFEDGHFDYIDDYLRPSLKSIHIIFPLRLAFPGPSEDDKMELVNITSIVNTLGDIQRYLQTPNCQLQNLTISFSSNVLLSITIENGILIEYDKHGPVYDDYDRQVWLTIKDPSYLIPLIDDYYEMNLQRAFQTLRASHKWKKFEVPLYFTNPRKMDRNSFKEVKELLQMEVNKN